MVTCQWGPILATKKINSNKLKTIGPTIIIALYTFEIIKIFFPSHLNSYPNIVSVINENGDMSMWSNLGDQQRYIKNLKKPIVLDPSFSNNSIIYIWND